MNTPDVFCLVPARSGSERIRDKNLREVGGRSLLARAVDVARAAFGAVWVSTDDQRYADHAVAVGARVPSLRPERLATSTASMDDVVQHAIDEWAGDCTTLVLIQPTSPFTSVDDVRTVAKRARDPAVACALTAVRLPPKVAYAIVADGQGDTGRFCLPDLSRCRTQDVPRLWAPTGGAYGASIDRIRTGLPLVVEPFAVVEVDANRAVDIDTEDDLRRAQESAS